MKKEKKKAGELFAKLFGEEKQEEIPPMEETGLFAEEDFTSTDEGGMELLFEKPEGEEHEGDYDFSECGRIFSAPKEVIEAFAAALGRKPKEVLEIYEKGCLYGKMMRELAEAKRDSEVFEKLAAMRGISKEEMKAEIFGAIEKAKMEKIIEELMAENPGMNEKTAGELAKYRLEAKMPKTVEKKTENKAEKIENMLREMEIFAAKHRGEGIESLDNGVIGEWEKGTSLEKAFENYRFEKEKEKLIAAMEEMKLQKEKLEKMDYLKKHSPGSATSASGVTVIDAFVEGLFKEY